MKVFNITIKLSDKTVNDLLCSALDPGYGGSYYWCNAERAKNEASKAPEYLHEVPLAGGTIIITDSEDESKMYVLDRKAVARGLQVMATLKEGEGGHHFADILKDSTDAGTGDVLVQCALFGKIVYG